MRLLAVAGVLAFALPASAADLDPEALVLRPGAMPPGYVVDGRASHETRNEAFTNHAGLEKVARRSGRVTGYLRVYRHRDSRLKVVHSVVEVFRRASGARMMVDWYDAQQRRHNKERGIIHAYGREPAGIGPESWIYWSGYPGYYVHVVWRHGRLVGSVVTWDLGRKGTLTLARLQQQRMAKAPQR